MDFSGPFPQFNHTLFFEWNGSCVKDVAFRVENNSMILTNLDEGKNTVI